MKVAIDVTVKPEELRRKIEELKNAGFNRPVIVIGTDHLDEQQIEVIYVLNNVETNENAIVRVRVPRDDPRVPSVSDILPGFRRREMETRDLVGVEFEGLQKPPEELGLKRFMLPHDRSEEPPLRKTYVPPARRKKQRGECVCISWALGKRMGGSSSTSCSIGALSTPDTAP